MEFHPTPNQQAFIRHAIDAGRIERPEEAVAEAMALWDEHERRRMEILSRVDEPEASIARGKGITIAEQSMRHLAIDVKQRGRDRLAAENAVGL